MADHLDLSGRIEAAVIRAGPAEIAKSKISTTHGAKRQRGYSMGSAYAGALPVIG
jgi:hypothetical protein